MNTHSGCFNKNGFCPKSDIFSIQNALVVVFAIKYLQKSEMKKEKKEIKLKN